MMYKAVMDILKEWDERTDTRVKMQHAYASLALVLVIAAGVIGLMNHQLGQTILFVAIAAAGMFVVNAIIWALLQSFVLLRIAAARQVKQARKTLKPRK